MIYRTLGRTGLKVSELSYGAARGAIAARSDFIATIHAAIDAGINLIDTASLYEDGESERAIGEALQSHDDIIVETKYRPMMPGARRPTTRAPQRNSLKQRSRAFALAPGPASISYWDTGSARLRRTTGSCTMDATRADPSA